MDPGKSLMVARFSTVARKAGAADAERDPRDFALKLHTEEGTWVLVGNNAWKPSSFHTEQPEENYRNAIGENHGRKD